MGISVGPQRSSRGNVLMTVLEKQNVLMGQIRIALRALNQL